MGHAVLQLEITFYVTSLPDWASGDRGEGFSRTAALSEDSWTSRVCVNALVPYDDTELFLWQQCDHREVRGRINNSVVVDMGKGNVYLGFMVKLQKKRTSLKVKVRWTGRRWFKKSDGS